MCAACLRTPTPVTRHAVARGVRGTCGIDTLNCPLVARVVGPPSVGGSHTTRFPRFQLTRPAGPAGGNEYDNCGLLRALVRRPFTARSALRWLEIGGSIGAQRFPQIRPAPARPPAGSVPTDRRRHRSHLLLRDDGVRFVGMCVEQGTDGALDPSWPPAHTATTTAPSSWSRARAGGARMRTPGLVPSMSLANLSLPYECAGDHIDI
jgi:hypothetical protein